MIRDSLGDRIKAQYEDRTRVHLPRRSYTVLRIDGRAFHTFTRGFDKPFDFGLMKAVADTAVYICQEAAGARFAYTQSDEVSVLLTDFQELTTEAWFDGNLQKLVSVSASLAAAKFNSLMPDGLPLAAFDCRAFSIPDPYEVGNYFLWRQRDWIRNSLAMLARSLYSSKQLHSKKRAELHEMCFQRGQNWNDLPNIAKRGNMVVKDGDGRWKVEAPPDFAQDWSYLYKRIPVIGVGDAWALKQAEAAVCAI